jgi:hypothetical protein
MLLYFPNLYQITIFHLLLYLYFIININKKIILWEVAKKKIRFFFDALLLTKFLLNMTANIRTDVVHMKDEKSYNQARYV